MIEDSGTYSIEAGAERVEIAHGLGVAPNIVTVDAPDGSEVYTLGNEALLVILPAGAAVTELRWSVGYEQPPEPKHEEEEMEEWTDHW